jgi:glycosyltransferase involved in cell wall biosynthesis
MRLFFLFGSYNPTSAVGNRCLAYMRGLSELKIPATFCFLLPDRERSRVIGEFPYITVKYLWAHWHINNRLLKYIPYLYHILRFRRTLKDDDRVYMYDLNDVPRYLFKKKGIKLFYEKTEHPLVSNFGSLLRRVSLKSHIEDCSKYDGIFVISYALRDYYISQGIDARKIHVINIIVDPERFTGLGTIEKKQQIVYCGNANNNKDGVDQLIKAFASIHKEFPDVKLVIIGPKPDELEKDNNISLARELGVIDKVVFTGKKPPQTIPILLAESSIAALDRPSNLQSKYGFPTKLGEYLLSGTTVVVTRVGDIPHYVEDKISAIIAEPDSISSFSDCLRWALNHPKEMIVIGERGKQIALNHFSYLGETKKLVDVMMA